MELKNMEQNWRESLNIVIDEGENKNDSVWKEGREETWQKSRKKS